MYYAHFGLKEPPFKITPNTEVFFTGANRGAVLQALIYAITNGEGIVKVVGEVGSGKTMLCRMLQAMLPGTVESIFLANPSVAPEHVLHAIAFELQLKLPKDADRLKVMQMLQSHLLARHAAGKQVVVFVEEAQSMPLATLEEIRLLSNLETKHDKLLQIVLFGQPELDDSLNQTNIRQLRERITHSFNLSPFSLKEISDYLIFRLRAAGYFGPPLFTQQAIKQISSSAQGLVRRVNILADKALLAAFADNVYLVTPKHVNAAINDSTFGFKKPPMAKKSQLMLWALILLTGLSLGYVASQAMQNGVFNLRNLNFGNTNLAKLNIANFYAPSQPKVTQKTSAKKVAVNKPVAIKAELHTDNYVSNNTIESLPIAVATEQEKKSEIEAKTDILIPAAQPALLITSLSQTAQPDILSSRLQATLTWLQTQAPTTVTIQLMGVGDEAQLKSALVLLAQKIEDRKSTRLNSSHSTLSRMPSSA